jgi:drug/metabolite transporter (DMT)-like permease
MDAALFHEWLGLSQIGGAAMIVGGIVLLQLNPFGL